LGAEIETEAPSQDSLIDLAEIKLSELENILELLRKRLNLLKQTTAHQVQPAQCSALNSPDQPATKQQQLVESTHQRPTLSTGPASPPVEQQVLEENGSVSGGLSGGEESGQRVGPPIEEASSNLHQDPSEKGGDGRARLASRDSERPAASQPEGARANWHTLPLDDADQIAADFEEWLAMDENRAHAEGQFGPDSAEITSGDLAEHRDPVSFSLEPKKSTPPQLSLDEDSHEDSKEVSRPKVSEIEGPVPGAQNGDFQEWEESKFQEPQSQAAQGAELHESPKREENTELKPKLWPEAGPKLEPQNQPTFASSKEDQPAAKAQQKEQLSQGREKNPIGELSLSDGRSTAKNQDFQGENSGQLQASQSEPTTSSPKSQQRQDQAEKPEGKSRLERPPLAPSGGMQPLAPPDKAKSNSQHAEPEKSRREQARLHSEVGSQVSQNWSQLNGEVSQVDPAPDDHQHGPGGTSQPVQVDDWDEDFDETGESWPSWFPLAAEEHHEGPLTAPISEQSSGTEQASGRVELPAELSEPEAREQQFESSKEAAASAKFGNQDDEDQEEEDEDQEEDLHFLKEEAELPLDEDDESLEEGEQSGALGAPPGVNSADSAQSAQVSRSEGGHLDLGQHGLPPTSGPQVRAELEPSNEAPGPPASSEGAPAAEKGADSGQPSPPDTGTGQQPGGATLGEDSRPEAAPQLGRQTNLQQWPEESEQSSENQPDGGEKSTRNWREWLPRQKGRVSQWGSRRFSSWQGGRRGDGAARHWGRPQKQVWRRVDRDKSGHGERQAYERGRTTGESWARRAQDVRARPVGASAHWPSGARASGRARTHHRSHRWRGSRAHERANAHDRWYAHERPYKDDQFYAYDDDDSYPEDEEQLFAPVVFVPVTFPMQRPSWTSRLRERVMSGKVGDLITKVRTHVKPRLEAAAQQSRAAAAMVADGLRHKLRRSGQPGGPHQPEVDSDKNEGQAEATEQAPIETPAQQAAADKGAWRNRMREPLASLALPYQRTLPDRVGKLAQVPQVPDDSQSGGQLLVDRPRESESASERSPKVDDKDRGGSPAASLSRLQQSRQSQSLELAADGRTLRRSSSASSSSSSSSSSFSAAQSSAAGH